MLPPACCHFTKDSIRSGCIWTYWVEGFLRLVSRHSAASQVSYIVGNIREKKKAKDFMQMWCTPPTKQNFFFQMFILSAASLEYTFSTYRCLKIERCSWHHWALPSQQDAFPCNISSRLQVTLQLWDAFGSSYWPGFIDTVILTHLVILTSTSTSNLYSKWVAAMKTR